MASAGTATRTGPESGAVVFDGFISYSHAADDLLAPRLQAGLQRFAKPWWRRRALRVFRDEASLSANPHLWSSITEAMDQSEWFVLLLSEDAARSEWVDREVAWWLEHKDPTRIIPVVTDGEFSWTGSDISPGSTVVPPSLQGAFSDEPRWVDLRFARTETQLDLRHTGFRAAVADIAAAIRQIPKDELESEEIRQHKLTTRTAWTAAATLLLLAVAATAATIIAIRQSQEARQNLGLALSRELSRAALDNLETDPELSILLALEAVEKVDSADRAERLAPVSALRTSLASSRILSRIDGRLFVDFSPDGQLVATGSSPGAPGDATLWDVESGDLVRSLTSPEGRSAERPRQAAFSPDGDTLAIGYLPDESGQSGPLVVLWDVASGEMAKVLDTDDLDAAVGIAFSPDGSWVAAQAWREGDDPQIVVWDVASGSERYRIKHDEGHWAESPSFSPDGTLLAAIDGGATVAFRIVVYDASTGLELSALQPPDGWRPNRVEFDPGGRRLAAVSQQPPGAVIWDLSTREVTLSWDLEGAPAELEWSPSGHAIAISGNDGTPRVFDSQTGDAQLTLLGGSQVAWDVAMSPDGTRLAAASWEADVVIWDIGAAAVREVRALDTRFSGISRMSYTTDGGGILILSDEAGDAATLVRVDSTTSEVLAALSNQYDAFPIRAMEFPAAGVVASLNSGMSGALHDALTFEPILQLPDGYYAIALSDDGTTAILNPITQEGDALVAEVGTWNTSATVPFVRYAFLSPDGSYAAVFPDGGPGLYLIDVDSGTTLAMLPEAFFGKFSPDGRYAALHHGEQLQLLDVARIAEGALPENAIVWDATAATGFVAWSRFNRDGSLIATIGADSQLRVWDTRSGVKVADFGTFCCTFPAFDFHPDGRHLIAEDTDGTIQILTLDEDELIQIATARLTRGFTSDECAAYLIDPCLSLDEIRRRSSS